MTDWRRDAVLTVAELLGPAFDREGYMLALGGASLWGVRVKVPTFIAVQSRAGAASSEDITRLARNMLKAKVIRGPANPALEAGSCTYSVTCQDGRQLYITFVVAEGNR